VTLSQIQQEAVALPERERIDLVRTLLDTLPPTGTDISDEEVALRERELESGQVQPLSHEEFVRRVEKERRR
jgi:putative addiction module component (TIGR02574 family)